MEKTKKELALDLIAQIEGLALRDDKEMTRLQRIENPHFATVGESAVSFHLRVLREIVNEL